MVPHLRKASSTPRLQAWILGLAVLGSATRGTARTAVEFLREAPPPKFRKDHTLPRLTRWGWSMPFDARVELADHWGYALEFGPEVTRRALESLNDPQSVTSRVCSLAAAEPRRYPLFVLLNRPLLRPEFRKSLPPETWCRDVDGRLIEDKQIWSPEAPDAVFARAADEAVGPLLQLKERVPIAIVLNGGEYGMSVYGFHGKVWAADPNVSRAKANQSWFEYLSKQKTRQEKIITDAVHRAVPNALYIYYHTFATDRNRYGNWWHWAYDFRYFHEVSDLPSSSIYYLHFNSGFSGDADMLTMALNGVAQQMALGRPLSYNWVNAGWTRKKLGDRSFADIARYMGYLKCYYTAGMIGGIAGYFHYPKGGFGGDLGDEPPHWLQQMMVLSRVHALFSHLEDFLREGELLPGPNPHRWSSDLPAYEFPTGDPGVRVLVRKKSRGPEWLLTAWAAAGETREVRVEVPELGTVTLRARPSGSVYRAVRRSGRTVLSLIDRDSSFPTRGL